jgi:hypothetical protein
MKRSDWADRNVKPPRRAIAATSTQFDEHLSGKPITDINAALIGDIVKARRPMQSPAPPSSVISWRCQLL